MRVISVVWIIFSVLMQRRAMEDYVHVDRRWIDRLPTRKAEEGQRRGCDIEARRQEFVEIGDLTFKKGMLISITPRVHPVRERTFMPPKKKTPPTAH
jgi:hypothetical protein